MNSTGGSNPPGPNPGGGSNNPGPGGNNPGPGGNHSGPVGNHPGPGNDAKEIVKSKLRRGISLIMRDRNGDACILKEGSHIGTQTCSTLVQRLSNTPDALSRDELSLLRDMLEAKNSSFHRAIYGPRIKYSVLDNL